MSSLCQMFESHCTECGKGWSLASEHIAGESPEDDEWFCSTDCKIDYQMRKLYDRS